MNVCRFCRADVFGICLNKTVLMFTMSQAKMNDYYARYRRAFFGLNYRYLTFSV